MKVTDEYKQKKADTLLVFIAAYIEEHGYPPSLLDIMEATDLSSKSHVRLYLLYLKEHGLITWQPRKARTLRILK